MADTVADGMIVEATAFENETSKGRMRIRAFFLKALGMVVGGVMASVLPNVESEDWALDLGQCFLLQVESPKNVLKAKCCSTFFFNFPTLRLVFPWLLFFRGWHALSSRYTVESASRTRPWT